MFTKKKAEPIIHTNRIGITSHSQSRTTRYFYTTDELTNWGQPNGITSVSQLNDHTDDATRQFVETLLATRGVAQITWLNPNRMILEINPMFTWDQVQDDVIAALMTRFGWTADNTSVLSYEDFQKLALERDKESLPASRL